MSDITKTVRELSARNPNFSLRELVRLLAECGQRLEITVVKKRKRLPAAKPEPLIVSKPGVLGGKPCVRGTRITVETIQRVAKEWTFLKILEEYPGLTPEGLAAALAYRMPTKTKKARRT